MEKRITSDEITIKRWEGYGQQRAYVELRGKQIGYIDLADGGIVRGKVNGSIPANGWVEAQIERNGLTVDDILARMGA